jgi:hypothetical protein
MPIRKPDADPLIAALLTFFVFGLGHMIPNGQNRKFYVNLIAIGVYIGVVVLIFGGTCLGSMIIPFCGCLNIIIFPIALIMMVFGVFSTIEAYKTAEALKAGKEIGENEYFFPLFHKIVAFADKTATLNPDAAAGNSDTPSDPPAA